MDRENLSVRWEFTKIRSKTMHFKGSQQFWKYPCSAPLTKNQHFFHHFLRVSCLPHPRTSHGGLPPPPPSPSAGLLSPGPSASLPNGELQCMLGDRSEFRERKALEQRLRCIHRIIYKEPGFGIWSVRRLRFRRLSPAGLAVGLNWSQK